MRFWDCVLYLIVTGVIGFFAGRTVPLGWFHPEKGIFRCFPAEKNGAVYERLGIKRWQKKVPDMSRLLPWLMPPKNLTGQYQQRLPVMIRETCKAELTHLLLCAAGLPVLGMLPGFGGAAVYLLYMAVFNLPYILIQRYNRPRLLRLYERQLAKEQAREEMVSA